MKERDRYSDHEKNKCNYGLSKPMDNTGSFLKRENSIIKIKIKCRNNKKYKFSFYRSIASLNKTSKSIRAWSDCTGERDHLIFYDGSSTNDPVLAKYCGGDWLPRVVSRYTFQLILFHVFKFIFYHIFLQRIRNAHCISFKPILSTT